MRRLRADGVKIADRLRARAGCASGPAGGKHHDRKHGRQASQAARARGAGVRMRATSGIRRRTRGVGRAVGRPHPSVQRRERLLADGEDVREGDRLRRPHRGRVVLQRLQLRRRRARRHPHRRPHPLRRRRAHPRPAARLAADRAGRGHRRARAGGEGRGLPGDARRPRGPRAGARAHPGRRHRADRYRPRRPLPGPGEVHGHRRARAGGGGQAAFPRALEGSGRASRRAPGRRRRHRHAVDRLRPVEDLRRARGADEPEHPGVRERRRHVGAAADRHDDRRPADEDRRRLGRPAQDRRPAAREAEAATAGAGRGAAGLPDRPQRAARPRRGRPRRGRRRG